MQGILHVPYIDEVIDDSSFVYNGPEIDYLGQINAASASIVGGDTFSNYIDNRQNQNSARFFGNQDHGQNVDYKTSYYEIPCEFYNMNGDLETIDELLSYYNSKDGFVIMILIDQDNSNEDAIIEFKGWVTESKKILDLPSNLYSDELKIGMQPSREFKFSSGTAKANLKECKLAGICDDKVAIYVNEIIFIN